VKDRSRISLNALKGRYSKTDFVYLLTVYLDVQFVSQVKRKRPHIAESTSSADLMRTPQTPGYSKSVLQESISTHVGKSVKDLMMELVPITVNVKRVNLITLNAETILFAVMAISILENVHISQDGVRTRRSVYQMKNAKDTRLMKITVVPVM